MADRIKGITIEIGGDTTKLQSALKEVNKQLKDTQSDLRDVDKLLKLDPGNTELLTQKHELLSKAVGETKEKLQQLKDAQAQMNANGVDKSTEEYQRLEREIIDCEQSLKKLEKAAKESNVSLQKVADAGQKLKSAGSSIESVGKEVSKASAVVATGMTAAVKTTMDFDAEMSKVKAISGATDEEFQQLRDTAREMGKETKFSASESAEAFEYMAMAGWNAQEMIEGIPGILALAASSGEELGTTSDIVTDGLTAFGLSAKDAGRFADVMAQASRTANTDVAMMGETFKYAGSVAGSMGYSIEDVAIATGLMANSGIKASQAGTALRSVMSRMADPSEDVAKAMEMLNLSLDDGQGNMYSFYEVMQQMRSGFGDLKISEDELNETMAKYDQMLEEGSMTQKEYDDSVEELMYRAYGAEGAMKAQAASMLAGKNALSGMLAIVNASDEDFNKLTEAIYGSDGAAQEMSDVMMDNLSGQLQILKSQLEELAISIGDILMPYVSQFVEWLQKLVDKFNNLDDWQKELIVQIGLFVVALGPVLLIIGKLLLFIGQIMTYAPAIGAAITAITTAVGGLIAAIGGPLLLAIGAVIAAVVVWTKNWDDIKLAFQYLREEMTEWVKNGVEVVMAAIDKLVTGFKEKFPWLSEVVSMFIDTFKAKIQFWVDLVKGAVEQIKGLLSGELKFPDVKLPHFKINGSFSWNPPKVPTIGVEWYKKAYDDAYLLNSATIFGAAGGKLLGGGEGNGSEAVVGTDKLMSMMAEVVGNQNITVVLEGDAQGVFNLVRTENTRFMKSNGGYSPLASY